jgi:hypothetical protein
VAIAASDIQFLLSSPQAGSGYSRAGIPGNSLGLFASTTQLSTTPMDSLFNDITGAQNAAGQVDYAALFIFNNNADHTMLNPLAWLPSSLLGSGNTATFAIGADPTPPSALGSTLPQAVAITNPTTAPAGVTTWASPSASSAGGVSLPNIPAKSVAAVWIRRTANGTASLNTFVADITFDTLA